MDIPELIKVINERLTFLSKLENDDELYHELDT